MKKTAFITFLVCLAAASAMAQNLTLDQILNKYYQAGNFAALAKVNTVVMSGTIVQQDLMPLKITKMRPDKYLMEYDVVDMTAYQGCDGATVWITAPWTGNATPQVPPADRATDLKLRADFEGILVDWEKNGPRAELSGTDTVHGQVAYKIKVLRKDGGTEYEFIDCKTFMQVKRLSTRILGGKEVGVENYFRDYRPVGGIPFPYAVRTLFAGRDTEWQFDLIELNRKVDPKIFGMPVK